MRLLSPLLTLLLIGVPLAPPAAAQVPQGAAPMLNLVIVEGEGAINNIKQRTQRETIVQVEDSNHRPVAGAAVAFTLPSNGASGTFANGGRSITTVTDSQGRASVPSLRSEPFVTSTKCAGPCPIGRADGNGSGRIGGWERYFAGGAPPSPALLKRHASTAATTARGGSA